MMKKFFKRVLMCAVIAVFVCAFAACDSVESSKYRVTFEADGGYLEKPFISVEKGGSIKLPETSKFGNTFGGWYSDKEFKNPVKSPYTPTKNITLYARFVPYSPTEDEFTYQYHADTDSYEISASTLSPYPAKIEIPQTFNGVPVKTVSRFSNKAITDLTIPDGVTKIANNAFWDCGSLENVTLGKGLTEIGPSAFDGCTSLKSISIPDSVTRIGAFAFNECTSLTSATLSKNLSLIENGIFEDCSNLKNITIPDGVTHIGSLAFSGCNKITEITVPDSVTEIESFAFYCDNLKTLNLGKGLKYIGASPFSEDSVEKLNFNGTVADWCAIDFDQSIIEYTTNGYLYIKNRLLTDLVIPSSVTKISQWAFYGCQSLESVIIPSSVTQIESYAFYFTPHCAYWCEPVSPPYGWDSDWGANNYFSTVFWGDVWHYVDGKPTLN